MAKPVVICERVKNKYGGDIRISGYDLEGTIPEAIALLQALQAEYAEDKIVLSWEQEQYEDSYSLFVKRERPENAEERALRLAASRRQAETNEIHERAMLARLKAKYEK